MDRMNYLNYTVADFVFDESFREWVLKKNMKSDAFWNGWIKKNPDKWSDVQRAMELIQAMETELDEDYSRESEQMWETISSGIDQIEEKQRFSDLKMVKLKQETTKAGKGERRNGWKILMGIAATITLLFVLSTVFIARDGMTIYKTGYGETKRVTLPDNSVVTLNANTILKIPNDWEQQEMRKVWIEGEAFFSVVKTEDHQKFLVHSRNVIVDVLGTKFNVNNRRDKNQVTLTSGRIELSIRKGNEVKKVVMSPGELVEISNHDHFEKRTVESEIYTSWRNNKLQFNNTKLSELVIILKENYGLDVIILDDSLRNREFTAVYPADDLGVLFKALSMSFDLRVERKGNTITLKPRTSGNEDTDD